MEDKQKVIDQLNEAQNYESEEEGYQRYMRRELFEGFLYSEDGLEFCGCGNVEESLRAVVKVLEFASAVSGEERSRVLMNTFGIEKASDNPLVQILFYLLTIKGFIRHSDDKEVNDSKITGLGQAFLPMLRNYLGI